MMVVSHDRCKAIVDPLGARTMSRRNAFLVLLLIWTFGSLRKCFLECARQLDDDSHFRFSSRATERPARAR